MNTLIRRSRFYAAASMLIVLLRAPLATAEIPEPDNVLYGTITLSNVQVTAARSDVIIEARRLIDGSAIASYRMGTNRRIGDFYALEIPVQSLAVDTNSVNSQSGDTLFIVVSDASGLRGQTTYVVGERGQVRRVDFGTALPDSDGDTLPDAWELLHFASLNQNAGSIAPNGRTVLENFVCGADPASTSGALNLTITLSNNQKIVSFLTRRAEGAGYEGRTRFYSLETGTGLAPASWSGVPGFTNVVGNNQTLIFQTTTTNTPAFFRGRVWLQGP